MNFGAFSGYGQPHQFNQLGSGYGGQPMNPMMMQQMNPMMGQMGQMGQMQQTLQMMMQMMRMMQQMQQMQQQMGGGMQQQMGGMPMQQMGGGMPMMPGGGMPGAGMPMMPGNGGMCLQGGGGGIPMQYPGGGYSQMRPPYSPPSYPYQGSNPGGFPQYPRYPNSGMQNGNGYNGQNPGNVSQQYLGQGAPSDGAQRAVQIAGSQIGNASQGLQLANYHSDGRVTNNCSEFVSSCLAGAGMFNKSSDDRDCNVSNFRTDLLKQGYQEVSKQQAQPGDVAIIGNSHTELVSQAGASKAIGANGSATETVSQQSLSWAGGNVKYYHKG